MEDIIKRLRSWGGPETDWGPGIVTGDVQLYLNAADEIERLRLEVETFRRLADISLVQIVDAELHSMSGRTYDAAVAEEREACAKLIETWEGCRYVEHVQELCECRPMAAAIRARSNS